MRIIFAGTPEFAADQLQALLDAGITPIACYSQPDRPKGRGKKLVATPVKAVAEKHDITVYQPLNFKEQADLEQLQSLNADLMIVVAYGLLLPKAVLDTPTMGCINVHTSILPRWRGAAPVERAIEAGDVETGVTIMQMDEGLDTGDMLKVERCEITDATTGDSLRETLSALSGGALIETVTNIAHALSQGKTIQGAAQAEEGANYAKKMTKQEAQIDWLQPASSILRKIHAFNSSNACYTHFNEERVKIFSCKKLADGDSQTAGNITAITKKAIEVACGENGTQRLSFSEIQLPNAKRMAVNAILNGKKGYFEVGSQFCFIG